MQAISIPLRQFDGEGRLRHPAFPGPKNASSLIAAQQGLLRGQSHTCRIINAQKVHKQESFDKLDRPP